MNTHPLKVLRRLSLLLLLPGLAGLIISSMISTHYLDIMPKMPVPEEMRMTPRNIHGVVVYQTLEENRELDLIEGVSVAAFVLGLGLGLVYLEKWGSLQARVSEQDKSALEKAG
jgi:hypothetical protein